MCVLLFFFLLFIVIVCIWVLIELVGKVICVLLVGLVLVGCIVKGEVVVIVKSKVGFYNCNLLWVQEELEMLVCNEVLSVGVNVVQVVVVFVDGSQCFVVFQCLLC